MYRINFDAPQHVYFMGIGGISMSGFAELLHTKGFIVTGSDTRKSKITEHLEKLGIHIVYEQVPENITKNLDLIVYTAAIGEDNPEFKAAKKSNIPMLDRAEMIGQAMENYKTAIGVSGTHGKTTTTSMLSHVMLSGNLDPTISVGGILKAIDGNIRIGRSHNFITEACEYTDSFLKFHPTIGIILNVEAEHLDYFKDINQIRTSFHKYASLIPEDGLLVINGEIENYPELIKDISCKVVTYSLTDPSCDLFAENISFNSFACGSFDLIVHGLKLRRMDLKVIGTHNISNALACIGVALELNISPEAIQDGLSSFTGTNRRFEYKGEVQGITVIDDYAHHPTEIQATLLSAKKYPCHEMWCVFQPHTYTRTKAFLKDFAAALSLADHIVLTNIYSAREADPGDISALDLKRELEVLGKKVYYSPDFHEIKNYLLRNCTHGDLLITMGAGDVVSIGESILQP